MPIDKCHLIFMDKADGGGERRREEERGGERRGEEGRGGERRGEEERGGESWLLETFA